MDDAVPSAGIDLRDPGPVPGGRQRAPGSGRADGGDVGPACGRGADGEPRFDPPVVRGGYLWWYVDALSDDGRHGLTLIAFVGSVFSPYYRRALARGAGDPGEHCALNVALYGPARRWTMTERPAASVHRSRDAFAVGPSELRWDGSSLVVDIDEVALPLPRRVRGRVRIHPRQLFRRIDALDDGGRHWWGPIAPVARVEVELHSPALRWSGQAYLDSNEGAEPVDRPFAGWDWSRAELGDGSCAVIYDVRQREAADRIVALRYRPDGVVEPFDAPPRQRLARSAWGIARHQRNEPGTPARIDRTLEDTPFYVRSVARANLLGAERVCMHETLHVGRLVSPAVQFLLPFRMPRRP